MTSRQYTRIEDLLSKVEAITLEHPFLTPEGKQIASEIRELLVKVAAERIRAEERERDVPAAPAS
jgi:hypothetical protein